MYLYTLRGLLPAALLVAAAAANAQPSTGPRPDPLNATAAVPAVVHNSAFAAYRRLGDDKPIGWKQANDTTQRIGGWRAYAREASQPESPASAPADTRRTEESVR